MKKILSILILMNFVSCVEKKYREFYPNGSLKIEAEVKNGVCNGKYLEYSENGKISLSGNLINGKKEGLFYGYKIDGTLKSIDTYVDNTLNGKSISFQNSIKYISEYVNGYPLKQLVIDTVSNFLIANCDGEYCRYYDDNTGKIDVIFYNKDTANVKSIFFDSKTSKIKSIKGKLDFLTKSDSLRLSRDYPDWQEQVKGWETKEQL